MHSIRPLIDIFKVPEENNYQPRILQKAKLSVNNVTFNAILRVAKIKGIN